MNKRKLYEVEVRFTYYAEAESDRDAAKHAAQAWDDNGADSKHVQAVEFSDHSLADNWTPGCLVYGTDDDVTLGDLLNRLPVRP